MRPSVIICNTELSTNKKSKGNSFPQLLIARLKLENIPYEVKNLSVIGGDYILTDVNVVIERKTMSDLINSWIYGSKSGRKRLDDQIKLMKTSYEDVKIIIMIEDYYKCIFDYDQRCIWLPLYEHQPSARKKQMGFYRININPDSVKGKLRSLKNNEGNINVSKLSGKEHAVKWMINLIKNEKKSGRKRTSIDSVRIKKEMKSIEDKMRFFLEGLPNIGGATAIKILNIFKTPINAFNNIDSWRQKISRISLNTIEECKKVLGIN